MRRTLLLAVLALPVSGCQRVESDGPPTVHLGRDECALCGMIISEERHCAGLLVDGSAGRTHKVFDDIGCMLDYAAEHSDERVLGSFVHDYVSRQWVGRPGPRSSRVSSGSRSRLAAGDSKFGTRA